MRERAKRYGGRLGRSYRLLGIAAAVGATVGLFVAGFDRIVEIVLLTRVYGLPMWATLVVPSAGIVLSRIILWAVGGRGTTTATADDFIHAYHDRSFLLRMRTMFARIGASIVALGSGVPLGLEGPSMYAGATLGVNAHRLLPAGARIADRRVLMVGGAAAGVAAIFKAPATGAIFALEVPYQDDFARKMLLPALISSATGYLAFVLINGTEPFFPVSGSSGFGIVQLLGAVMVGIIAGLGARVFSRMVRVAKRIGGGSASGWAMVASGALLVPLTWWGWLLTSRPVTLGAGAEVLSWLLTDTPSLWVLIAVLALRCLVTSVAIAGGSVGGVFIPLAIAGALTGAIVARLVGVTDTGLFIVVGVAAFLGAGYRVPLAAVMFVAETTGRPALIVPGLLASVAAELMMGGDSVAPYQVRTESGFGL
jgi:CIC family chloride channel protein